MNKFFLENSKGTDLNLDGCQLLFCNMKVVLQNRDTKLFFRKPGAWTADVDKARDFPNSLNAINFCHANRLKQVQVLLKFSQERYDVALPILEPREPH